MQEQDMTDSLDAEEWEHYEELENGTIFISESFYPLPLLKRCLCKVYTMIKLGYYRFKTLKCLSNFNPKRNRNPLGLPNNLNEMIFKRLIYDSTPYIPKEVVLRPILMSCMEKIEFSVLCRYSNIESLNDIIVRLTDYAENIKVINIALASGHSYAHHSIIYEINTWNDQSIFNDLSKNFTKLLNKCRNLRKLKANFLFDNRILSSLPYLEELDLSFLNSNHELNKYCSGFKIWDKVDLVQNLPELRYLNRGELNFCDFIANREFDDFSLTRPCKIMFLKFAVQATEKTFKLINRLFPALNEVCLVLNMYTLEDLKKLEKYLTRYWLHIRGNYLRYHIRFLMVHGHLIYVMRMRFDKMTKTKFLCIISWLPNLKYLSVYNICLCTSNFEPLVENKKSIESAARVFNKMKEFEFNCCTCDSYEIYADFLIFVFTRCTNISSMYIGYWNFDDNIMYRVMNVNRLSFLKRFECGLCILTKTFVNDLLTLVPTVEFIRINNKRYISPFGRLSTKRISINNEVY